MCDSLHLTVHLSPAEPELCHRNTATCAPTHAQYKTKKKKHKLSLLLPFGWRAKFEGKGKKKVHRPPLGCHTAAQACVHPRRTRRALLPHGTARPFYLQMVLLGRNVTFDSVPLTERASGPVRCGVVCDRAFLASPGPRINEHMIVCTAKAIGLTRFEKKKEKTRKKTVS